MSSESTTQTDCTASCPVRKTADILEHKWATQIVRELLAGKKRYSELEQSLSGISAKVLSARLRHLENKGLLTRTVYPTVPPSTEYQLTAVGEKFERVLRAMQEFGTLLPDIETAQELGS